MKKEIERISVSLEDTIHEALKVMDKTNVRLLLVTESNKFLSLLSMGDIQRAIISGFKIDALIKNILREKVEVASPEDDIPNLKKRMLINKTEFMPIIDFNKDIVNVIFWEDLFAEKVRNDEKLNLPVIIMAGGKGTRMQPLTTVIPKPLIPLDNKTIAEHIINNFQRIGCNNFYFSVNYKAKMVRDYFKELNKDYHIEFFEETKPLGTAGSLHLLRGKINKTFFISNCDILIKEDYREIYKYHKEFNNELTIVGSFKHYPIPYGTLETGKDGKLISLHEKPQLSFLINSGMYVLEPDLIDETPQNEFFHITDLIGKIQARNGKVGVFPISEKSWIDIGEWEQYINTLKDWKNYHGK